VPTICILEVFKRVLRQRGEGSALQTIFAMQQGKVMDLTTAIALSAAKGGNDIKLPLVDSVILATARAADACIWTQDSDFKDIEGVKYRPRKKA